MRQRSQRPGRRAASGLKRFTPEQARVSEVLGALSFALDLAEGQPFGHALRSCWIGMQVAQRIGLSPAEQHDLYYALLLKDVGCSSDAARMHELFGSDDRIAKHDLKRVDWSNGLQAARYALSHAAPGAPWPERVRRMAALAYDGNRAANELVEARAARGATIVRQLGFSEAVGDAVATVDEHWDGHGRPAGLRGTAIPLLARIVGLAQTVEVFAAREGVGGALVVARARRGTWFDPALVDAGAALQEEIAPCYALDEWDLLSAVRDLEPGEAGVLTGPGNLELIAAVFAALVDAKSAFTHLHSARVTAIATEVAKVLDLTPAEAAEVRHAALLHDIGKLSVPNSILDKPGPLTAQEWETMRLHPYYTHRILDRVEGFQHLAFVASSHHERLDGRGYFRSLRGDQIPLGARVLAVCDIFEALTADRPYRAALLVPAALEVLERDRGIGVDADCLEALGQVIELGASPAAERRVA